MGEVPGAAGEVRKDYSNTHPEAYLQYVRETIEAPDVTQRHLGASVFTVFRPFI